MKYLAPLSIFLAFASPLMACTSSSSNAADGGSQPQDASASDSTSSTDSASSGDSSPPQADASSNDSSPADSASNDSASSSDATSFTDAANTCNKLGFGAPETTFVITTGGPTGLTGGAVVDGTYDLVRAETYNPQYTGFAQRSTFRFAGNVMEQVDQLRTSLGLGPAQGASGTFTVTGGTLQLTSTCSERSNPGGAFNYDSQPVNGTQQFRIVSGAILYTFDKRP